MTAEPYQIMPALDADVKAALVDSIKRFGVIYPVILTASGTIVDGHHRRTIADSLGVDYPTIRLDTDDPEKCAELAAELNLSRRHMTKDDRVRQVIALRDAGHSLRSIAKALGVSTEQTRKDQRSGQVSSSGHLTAHPKPTKPKVQGGDGKTYPASQPTKAELAQRHAAIALHLDEGKSYDEIAGLLAISKGTVVTAVKSLQKAEKAERKRLENEAVPPPPDAGHVAHQQAFPEEHDPVEVSNRARSEKIARALADLDSALNGARTPDAVVDGWRPGSARKGAAGSTHVLTVEGMRAVATAVLALADAFEAEEAAAA